MFDFPLLHAAQHLEVVDGVEQHFFFLLDLWVFLDAGEPPIGEVSQVLLFDLDLHEGIVFVFIGKSESLVEI